MKSAVLSCSMRSTAPWRIASAIDTARPASFLLTILPSASMTSSSFDAASGESGIVFARRNSSLRTSSDGPGDRMRHRGRHPRSALDRRLRQRRIAELDGDVVDRQAEHVGRHLRHDRVGAGADVGGRAGDLGVSVRGQHDADGGLSSAALPRCRSPCPSRPARCRRASSAARRCASPSRTPRAPWR